MRPESAATFGRPESIAILGRSESAATLGRSGSTANLAVLTWRMPSLLRQAWRKKLAIDFIIWFVRACAVFVIIFLGLMVCPTEHVFSTSELASHSYTTSPNNVYTPTHGEVFDLTTVATTHQRIVHGTRYVSTF